MPSVLFVVPFIKGKARPRFSNGRAYTPKPTQAAQRQIQDAYCLKCLKRHGAVLKAPDGVPVDVTIVTRRGVLSGFRKRDGDSHADIQKPDADNIAKLVLDALNGVAYDDDSQVNGLTVYKGRRVRGATPETSIYVHWKDGND